MRARARKPSKNYYFTVNEERYTIKQNGQLTAWIFYARENGTVEFSVWRPDPTDENMQVLLVSLRIICPVVRKCFAYLFTKRDQ